MEVQLTPETVDIIKVKDMLWHKQKQNKKSIFKKTEYVALFEWMLRLTDNVILMMPVILSQPTHPTTQMHFTFVSYNAVWPASRA